MKRAYYAVQDQALHDAVVDYDIDMGGKSEITVCVDRDGPYIKGPCDEVDAVIARITESNGVDPVHVEVVDTHDEDVSLSEIGGDWPAAEHDDHAENMDDEIEADDCEFRLEA